MAEVAAPTPMFAQRALDVVGEGGTAQHDPALSRPAPSRTAKVDLSEPVRPESPT